LVRLWLNGQDMGTASDRIGFMWLDACAELHPGEDFTIERVPDGAPTFEGTGSLFNPVIPWEPIGRALVAKARKQFLANPATPDPDP
jgi:hypothetical protein